MNAPLCNITDPCYINAAVELNDDLSVYKQYCGECRHRLYFDRLSCKGIFTESTITMGNRMN